MIGRDASYAVLCTDPAAPPHVFKLSVARAVANDIGDVPAGDRVASAGDRGLVLKPTGKQPDRPIPTATVDAVPLTDVVVARLVNHYMRQIADPSFSPTRGLALVSRTSGTATKPSAPEVLGDAVLPFALREKIRASGAKRLVLIPDGALHKLPFEALLLSAEPAPKYALVELPAVAYAPSLAVLAVVLNRSRANDGEASLLTVGDPAYPEAATGALPRLPYTATESKKVRQFFPADRVTAFEQADATEANVVREMPGKRFVHLAAHGFADEAFGNAFAAIALTPPVGRAEPGNDGFLTLHEISRLRLTGCELTVLSACVTNVGPQRPLEAGLTLAGAFLGAGSRGVMASCWSVDDRATAEMMAAFFGAVRSAKGPGAAHADALKAARLAIRDPRHAGLGGAVLLGAVRVRRPAGVASAHRPLSDRAATTAAADGNRSAGFFSRRRITTASSQTGRSGRRSRIGVGLVEQAAYRTATKLVPGNGGSPVQSEYNTPPRLYKSEAVDAGCPWICSGDMK